LNQSKNLVILVSDYPFGTGEPFLEDEIKLLSKKFEKIIFLHKSESKNKNNKYTLYYPENSTIEFLHGKRKLSFFIKVKIFLSFVFIYEFFLAIFKHKRKLNFNLIRIISYYWSSGYNGEKKIIDIVKKLDLQLSDTLFYSYWCDEYAISLARLAKKNKLKFVVRLHGWDLYFERHESNYLPFREFIFNHAYRIYPISDDGRKYIMNRKQCLESNKIITSRLGVKDLNENILYKTKSFQKNKLVILTLSHINPVKRLDRLVDVISEINDLDIDWIHIGYGFEKIEKDFKNYTSKKLNSSNNVSYSFLGHLNKSEVFDYLENKPVDLILNVSDTEGVPVSLMEAASASIPIIAFNIGGIPSLVEDSRNGYLLIYSKDNQENLRQLKDSIYKFNKLDFLQRLNFSRESKLIWSEKYNSENSSRYFIDSIDEHFQLEKRECKNCLIDNLIYPDIVLDRFGVCDVCEIVNLKNEKLEEQRKNNYLEKLLSEIKNNSKNKKYNCIIGISGGVDSAYLALKASEWGLNPLLVHIDNGWNSETAVSNINKIIKNLNFDLHTVVIDWLEVRDLVRSFLKASVIDIDWANEMCAQAALNEVAKKFGIKYILTGHQLSTEGWMPDNIVHYKLDLVNFKAIHKRFGEIKLKTYPTIGFLKTFYYEKILGIRFYYPLDYIHYNKELVKKELSDNYGWKDYGQKHFENIFTRFYQGYLLIKKFNIDKRKFHYSASILSGQISKENAKQLIYSNEYVDSGQMERDKEFICKKLGFSSIEFENIINSEPKKHTDYPSIITILNKLKKLKRVLQNNR
jgi:N-acetyl sugar amidotransferase